MSGPYRVVGKRLPRLDASGKVTGRLLYGTDFALPGTLHGKVLRSPHPHAKIRALHTTAARRMPGVRAVVTAEDIPTSRFGSFIKDIDVFARDTVRYVGHPVAAVAATSPEAAEAALAAIAVDYAELPFVEDAHGALLPDAPLVHEEWREYQAVPAVVREGNVCNRARLRLGDVDAALAGAARIYEDRFETALVHPGYTEPRAALAAWDEDALTVWSNTQTPFEQQARLAEIFAIPLSQVRVILTGIGGGFGGKLRLGVEHYAAALARKAGRPVKIVATVEEEIATGYSRQPAVIDLVTGVDAEGRIVARKGRILVDCGAMSGSGVGVASSAILMVAGPYVIPNLDIEGIAVYTNKAPTGSFRAPSGPQGNFAAESQMDIIARDLGEDPLAFRLRHIVRDGDLGPNGQPMGTVSLEECLLKAAEAIDWGAPSPPGRGKGLACGWWTMTGQSSGVFVKVNPDGRVDLSTGAAEIGSGALTGAAQVLAEALGVALDRIRIVSADTRATPFDFGAQGSRTASMVGNACLDAVARIREKARPLAAERLGVAPETLEFRDDAIIGGNRSMTLAEVAALSQASAGGLIAEGTFIAGGTPFARERTEGMVISTINSPSYHAHAVDLSVDPDTGDITIHDYVVAQDVGFAINPTYVEGQIEGGVTQGIGQALSEEVVWREGQVQNPNLTDYKMPTIADVPDIRSILVERAGDTGPYGAKGVGEPGIIEPPAALANAIDAATGLRIRRLPMTPERITMARLGKDDG